MNKKKPIASKIKNICALCLQWKITACTINKN